MNPYLPLYEYIPDAEPRIFEGRLYVYGSHDYAGGEKGFCPGDYMVWSADPEDLENWRCDGVAFARKDCPGMTDTDAMAAPDVVQEEAFGNDERRFLHYIANIRQDTIVGYKYFRWKEVSSISLRVKGHGPVKIRVCLDAPKGLCIGETEEILREDWDWVKVLLKPVKGVHGLYLHFSSEEAVCFMEFRF